MPTPRGTVLPSGGRKVIGGLDEPDPHAAMRYVLGTTEDARLVEAALAADIKPWAGQTIGGKHDS